MSSIVQILQVGGIVTWILLALSVTALCVVLFKVCQFWLMLKLQSNAAAEALQHLDAQKKAQALLLVQGNPNPRARIINQTLHLQENPNLDPQRLREESLRLARIEVGQLTSHLRILEVIANLAPLLGLFGTVLGMIEAFRAMEAAGSQVNPAILSGGIWVALLTTAVGLAVAIPVSMLHSWLERTAESEASGIQDALERTLTLGAMHPHLSRDLDRRRAEA